MGEAKEGGERGAKESERIPGLTSQKDILISLSKIYLWNGEGNLDFLLAGGFTLRGRVKEM